MNYGQNTTIYDMARRKPNKWELEEYKILVNMALDGKTSGEVAEKLGRGLPTVSSYMSLVSRIVTGEPIGDSHPPRRLCEIIETEMSRRLNVKTEPPAKEKDPDQIDGEQMGRIMYALGKMCEAIETTNEKLERISKMLEVLGEVVADDGKTFSETLKEIHQDMNLNHDNAALALKDFRAEMACQIRKLKNNGGVRT